MKLIKIVQQPLELNTERFPALCRQCGEELPRGEKVVSRKGYRKNIRYHIECAERLNLLE